MLGFGATRLSLTYIGDVFPNARSTPHARRYGSRCRQSRALAPEWVVLRDPTTSARPSGGNGPGPLLGKGCGGLGGKGAECLGSRGGSGSAQVSVGCSGSRRTDMVQPCGAPLAKGCPLPPRLFLTTLSSSFAATVVQVEPPILILHHLIKAFIPFPQSSEAGDRRVASAAADAPRGDGYAGWG